MICTDRGRGHGSFPSWGRKKRQIDGEHADESDNSAEETVVEGSFAPDSTEASSTNSTDGENPEEEVHELFRVYLSRADIPSAAESKAQVQPSVEEQRAEAITPSVCVTQSGYYAMVTAITILSSLILAMTVAAYHIFRKSKLPLSSVSARS